jgi:putative isomerase
MWRGPVWININWLICIALDQNGYSKEARELARKTVELVGPVYKGTQRTRTPRMNEWYNPITGEPLGNENLSWSSIVADLILRFLNE